MAMDDTRIEQCPTCKGTGWLEDSRGVHHQCPHCRGDGVVEMHYLDEAAYREEGRRTMASLRKLHAMGIWEIGNLPPDDVDELPGDWQFSVRPGPNLEAALQDTMQRRGLSRDDALLVVGEELMRLMSSHEEN